MTLTGKIAQKAGKRIGRPKGWGALAAVVVLAFWLSLAFSQTGPPASPAQKHVRLYVVAFGMKGQTKGLDQLRAIADAGHGKFSTAESFQQLEEAFIRVVQDTSTVTVKWPERPQESSGPGKKEQKAWEDPWVRGLAALLVVLIFATLGVAYARFRPGYRVVLKEPQQEQRTVAVRRRSIWVGRDPSCNVQVKDNTVSRKHLSLVMKKEGVDCYDNQTENGTFIDGEKVSRKLVTYGQVLLIGKTQLRVIRG